jgi:DNA-binding transcriptional MerR regulator
VKVAAQELMPIGRFARLTGLTVTALRHYDLIGLLQPARVDEETGYRYYTLAQARDGEAIRRLRELELPLGEIGALVDADEGELRDALRAHRARLEGKLVATAQIVAELDRVIERREPLVAEFKHMIRFELHVDDVDGLEALVVRDRAQSDELSSVIPSQIEEVGGYLKELGVTPAGPPFCVCPMPDEKGVAEVQTGWPVAGVPGRGRIEAVTYPPTRALVLKHEGPYESLSRSYRLMEEVMRDNDLRAAGDPREHYLSDPAEVTDPNDYETRIVWPIGPEGELKPPAGDVFKKRVEPPTG